MPRDDISLEDDEKGALQELRAAGGKKRIAQCGFSSATVTRLVAGGFATLDEGSTDTANVRMTVKGRIAIVDDSGPIP